MKNIIILLLIAIAITSCEDKIKLELPPEASQLAVEAKIINYEYADFINPNKSYVRASVKLSMTNGYDAGPNGTVSDALVTMFDVTDIKVVDVNTTITNTLNTALFDTLKSLAGNKLIHKGDGIYESNSMQGKVNRIYALTIEHNGSTYFSIDTLKRVPKIDSVLVVNKDKPEFGRAPGYFIELQAKDLVGKGDYYRIKTYKNEILFNRPSDINLAFDGGFSPTSDNDATKFVFPIANLAVNPGTGISDESSNGDKSTFVAGDIARIEIWSLSLPSIFFYNQLRNELTNEGLFARPPANLPCNIINANANGPKAVGWFSASAVSGKDVVIK